MDADIREILMHSLILPRRLRKITKDRKEECDLAAAQETAWNQDATSTYRSNLDRQMNQLVAADLSWMISGFR